MTKTANRKDVATAARGVTLEHRHFAAIAAIIARMPSDGLNATTTRNVAQHFAHYCADTNPRFDRARFLAACGVE